MNLVDIAIIVFIALFALLGLLKGIGKSLIAFLGFAAAFCIALFASKAIGEALLGVEFIRNFVLSSQDVSLYNIVYGFIGGTTQDLSQYSEPIADIIANYANYGLSEAQAISLYYTDLIYNIAVAIVLFFISRLVMGIITVLLKSFILKGKSKTLLSRIFGFVFGAVRGAVMAVVILVILATVSSVPFLPVEAVSAELNGSTIGKPVIDIVQPIAQDIIKIDSEYFDRIAALADATAAQQGENESAFHSSFVFEDCLTNVVSINPVSEYNANCWA